MIPLGHLAQRLVETADIPIERSHAFPVSHAETDMVHAQNAARHRSLLPAQHWTDTPIPGAVVRYLTIHESLYHFWRKEALMTKPRWIDLSAGQQVGIIVLATVQIGLLAAALWDLAHPNAEEVRGSRRMWAGLVFINWIGPLAYFVFGRKNGICCLPRCASKFGGGEVEAQ
jgi:hypothetical protein